MPDSGVLDVKAIFVRRIFMSRHRPIVAVCLLVLMAQYLLVPTRAWAQAPADGTGNSSAAPQDNTQTFLDPPKVDLPRERTGVNQNKVLNLALRDAITMALENNLDIQIEKDNIKIAEYNLLAAFG